MSAVSRRVLHGILAAASLAFGRAEACSVCGCGDPLLATNDPAAINGRLRFQLDTEYLRMDAGTDGRPGYTDKLTQWSYRLNAVYRPLDNLSVTTTVPLAYKTIHTVGGGTDVADSGLTGLGDVELGARYAFFTKVSFAARRVQELAVSVGSSFPTGEYNAKAADGTLIDPHGQLGTGAYGPFAGLHYRFEQGEFSAFASVSYRLRTVATYFDGSRYKFGDAFLWSVHGQYLVAKGLSIDLGIDGRYARVDTAADAGVAGLSTVESTGGTVLSAAPGVYLNAVSSVWLFVRAQVPFYQGLFGQQQVYPSFTTGLQFQAF